MPRESLSPLSVPQELHGIVGRRAEQREAEHLRELNIRVNWMFVVLMILQWIGGVVAALILSPQTWTGPTAAIHPHIIGATLLGAAMISFPIALVVTDPSRPINPYVIGVTQMLVSALLILISGGRIETHFHVFGSLAFLSLYRDWRVLIPAILTVSLDHLVRGTVWPEDVFGVDAPGRWRWLEHTAWLVFEGAVLTFACVQSRREMRQLAWQWAGLSATKETVDAEVRRQVHVLEQKQLQLQESERRLRTVIDTTFDAFIVLDGQGRIVEWSRRAEQLFGWPSQQAVGEEARALFQTDALRETIVRMLKRNNDKPYSVEMGLQDRSGRTIGVEVSLGCLWRDGEPQINAFVHEITERKILQAQLVHSQKMEAVGQLAAGIAHEINTPTQFVGDNLTFLRESFGELESVLALFVSDQARLDRKAMTASDLLQTLRRTVEESDLEYLREEIPRAIEQSLEGVGRIGTLTRAMKEFSHPGTAEKVPVDLPKAIDSTVVVCRNEWKYVADVRTEFDPGLTEVPCLPGELNQVLLNIIVNAAQAIGEISDRLPGGRGEIVIRTRRDEDWAEISIEDNGPGIPEAIRDRIFEPFFTTKDVGKGSGQGLAIAHSVIVDKHGGTIQVESKPGRGTAFILRIPLGQDANEEETSIHEEACVVC